MESLCGQPSSGAYGIPQSLGHGHPYDLGDYAAQINWGLSYIKGRYGSPNVAWAHELANNWYDQGGYAAPGRTLVNNGTGQPEMMLPPGMSRTLESINAAVQTAPGAAVAAPIQSGRSVVVNNHITQQPREDGSVLAAGYQRRPRGP